MSAMRLFFLRDASLAGASVNTNMSEPGGAPVRASCVTNTIRDLVIIIKISIKVVIYGTDFVVFVDITCNPDKDISARSPPPDADSESMAALKTFGSVVLNTGPKAEGDKRNMLICDISVDLMVEWLKQMFYLGL